MKIVYALACFASLVCMTPARGEVVQRAADGFHVRAQADLRGTPQQVYADLLRIGRWWNPAHTYSGDAAHLSLQARAGGCFCERWKGGSVEHARVIAALPDHSLVLDGALGPLQPMAVTGVLQFTLKAHDHGTRVEVDYRVNGASLSGLDALAPAVDQVIGEQVRRLAAFSDGEHAPAPH
ncbi:hypothetical protein [Oleiagrimonas soli]|uniref:Uncharacterized protein YndB with AHSA1/START domain n=1 Tax=Oleiagrimonas soli TaxID=1543381 RepID=A0A099CZN0_9GAMM|nr:hypothetical protein [Oleiagrimonas soli]KGI79146.1 hypothetical protein LF63_0100395 [Oleiagrimonas soli]MBB6184822.1 uncharacterized protein YndB with AHSA1/START domain [Oleiagrimonas soli]